MFLQPFVVDLVMHFITRRVSERREWKIELQLIKSTPAVAFWKANSSNDFLRSSVRFPRGGC